MKKFTLVCMVMVAAVTFAFAQNLASCQQTCEIEKVVQEGPFLGVTIVNERSCSVKILVQDIVENSAAEKFDFRKGDYILSIDGVDMENTAAVKELILSHQPADVISVIISRDGEDVIKDVAIGALKTRVETQTVCCDEKNEFLNELNISLSPNPSSDVISLSLDKAKPGKYTFQMFNTAGIEVQVAVESIEGGFEKAFDVSKLAAGQYFLKVSEGKSSYTSSFVVAR